MALARRIAYNVVFNSLAKVASTALALIGIGLITRYLGAGGFGDYATALAFFSLFGSLADLGLSSLLSREISRENADESFILGRIVSLRIASSFLVFALSLLVIPFFPYSTEVRWGIALSAAAFLFSSSSGILNGIFQKRLIMFRVAVVEFSGKILQIGIIAAAVFFDWGFSVIVLSLTVSMAWNTLLIFWMSKRLIPFRLLFDTTFWREFLKNSLPVGAVSIVTFAYFKADTILLSILKGSSDVGIYNAAYKIIENLTFFPAMIAGLVLPLFSRYIFQDKESFRLIADKTFKVFVAFAAPLAIGGFLLAEPLAILIGGSEFRESAAPFRFLVFALAAIFFGNFFNAIIIAGNEQKRLLKILSIVAVANISANLLIIPVFSFQGAAFTSLLTESSVAIATAILTSRAIGYRPSLAGIPRILISTGAMGAILVALQGHSFALLVSIGVLVYICSLAITGALTKEELLLLFSRSERRGRFISGTTSQESPL